MKVFMLSFTRKTQMGSSQVIVQVKEKSEFADINLPDKHFIQKLHVLQPLGSLWGWQTEEGCREKVLLTCTHNPLNSAHIIF